MHTDAEALEGNATHHQIREDRDALAKPEGIKTGRPPEHPLRSASADTGASTPGSEESVFDWDETDSSDEEEVAATKRAKEEVEIDRHRHNVRRAKRLRKVYMACMRISRPVRTALIALIGGGILIVPAVVVWTAYSNDRSSPVVRDNVKVWSIWLMVLWTCEELCIVIIRPVLECSLRLLPSGVTAVM